MVSSTMNVPMIAVQNHSTVVADSDVVVAVAALNKQVNNEFAQAWGLTGLLTAFKKTDPIPAGFWLMVLGDDSDQAGALGYHEDDGKSGRPAGFVFAKTDQKYGLSWTVTLSHEILEMLVDPWIDAMALQQTSQRQGVVVAYEVCDPVEADGLGYEIDQVKVSDFVYPAYFTLGSNAPFDQMKHLKKPFQVAAGGYLSVFRFGIGWTQLQGSNKSKRLSRAIRFSRTRRRMGESLPGTVFGMSDAPPAPGA